MNRRCRQLPAVTNAIFAASGAHSDPPAVEERLQMGLRFAVTALVFGAVFGVRVTAGRVDSPALRRPRATGSTARNRRSGATLCAKHCERCHDPPRSRRQAGTADHRASSWTWQDRNLGELFSDFHDHAVRWRGVSVDETLAAVASAQSQQLENAAPLKNDDAMKAIVIVKNPTGQPPSPRLRRSAEARAGGRAKARAR